MAAKPSTVLDLRHLHELILETRSFVCLADLRGVRVGVWFEQLPHGVALGRKRVRLLLLTSLDTHGALAIVILVQDWSVSDLLHSARRL